MHIHSKLANCVGGCLFYIKKIFLRVYGQTEISVLCVFHV